MMPGLGFGCEVLGAVVGHRDSWIGAGLERPQPWNLAFLVDPFDGVTPHDL